MRFTKLVLVLLAVGLLVGGAQGIALAQTTQGAPATSYPSDDSQTGAMKPGGTPTGSQAGVTVTGKITELDLANGTMTLNDGEQFTLPQNIEYTSFPMVGQAVEVTFSEQNGQKVVREIGADDTGRSSSRSD